MIFLLVIIFSAISPWAREQKKKINKWDYIKVSSFGTARKSLMRQKDNLLNERRYSPVIHPIRGQCPKFIKKSYNSTPRKQTIQFKKENGAEDLNRPFSKEDRHIISVQRH